MLIKVLSKINLELKYNKEKNEKRIQAEEINYNKEKMNNRENGCSLIDTYRILHPNQRNAYTCFCNQLGGRETNFGSRIDYIFCDQSLQESIQASDILSTMKGSDHLPVRTGNHCIQLN